MYTIKDRSKIGIFLVWELIWYKISKNNRQPNSNINHQKCPLANDQMPKCQNDPNFIENKIEASNV